MMLYSEAASPAFDVASQDLCAAKEKGSGCKLQDSFGNMQLVNQAWWV